MAEGALAAGCRFYAGYPITPSSEIFEELALKLPKIGGICVQMEDEIASLGAVIGASWAGLKSMTATSGPGFSLMQEQIGYAAMTETPCVIVNVMRAGPCTGQATLVGQGDVYQARYGSHGADFELITIIPSTVEECYYLTIDAFNFAEQYRVPVILLSDEHIGHLRETVVLREKPKVVNRRTPKGKDEIFFSRTLDNNSVPPMPRLGDGYNVLVTGSTHDGRGLRDTLGGETHRKLVQRLAAKIMENKERIIKVDVRKPRKAKIGIISYGSVSRAVWEAAEIAAKDKIEVAQLRLITLWPFPGEEVKRFSSNLRHVIVPELNLGMVVREIMRYLGDKTKAHSISKVGGGEPITPEETLDKVVSLS